VLSIGIENQVTIYSINYTQESYTYEVKTCFSGVLKEKLFENF